MSSSGSPKNGSAADSARFRDTRISLGATQNPYSRYVISKWEMGHLLIPDSVWDAVNRLKVDHEATQQRIRDLRVTQDENGEAEEDDSPRSGAVSAQRKRSADAVVSSGGDSNSGSSGPRAAPGNGGTKRNTVRSSEHLEKRRKKGNADSVRCQCDNPSSVFGLMIQCDDCEAWVHARCYGYYSRKMLPESFFCKECESDAMAMQHRTRLLASAKRFRDIRAELGISQEDYAQQLSSSSMPMSRYNVSKYESAVIEVTPDLLQAAEELLRKHGGQVGNRATSVRSDSRGRGASGSADGGARANGSVAGSARTAERGSGAGNGAGSGNGSGNGGVSAGARAGGAGDGVRKQERAEKGSGIVPGGSSSQSGKKSGSGRGNGNAPHALSGNQGASNGGGGGDVKRRGAAPSGRGRQQGDRGDTQRDSAAAAGGGSAQRRRRKNEDDWLAPYKIACPCGINEDFGEMMVQCEKCMAWQHCECIGFADQQNMPEHYKCEQCEKGLPPLKGAMVNPVEKPSLKSSLPPRPLAQAAAGGGDDESVMDGFEQLENVESECDQVHLEDLTMEAFHRDLPDVPDDNTKHSPAPGSRDARFSKIVSVMLSEAIRSGSAAQPQTYLLQHAFQNGINPAYFSTMQLAHGNPSLYNMQMTPTGMLVDPTSFLPANTMGTDDHLRSGEGTAAGLHVKAIRNCIGISQTEFARQLRPERPFSRYVVSSWECGTSPVPERDLERAYSVLRRAIESSEVSLERVERHFMREGLTLHQQYLGASAGRSFANGIQGVGGASFVASNALKAES